MTTMYIVETAEGNFVTNNRPIKFTHDVNQACYFTKEDALALCEELPGAEMLEMKVL